MGTTLTGTTPQDTYDSLIKVTDNGPLSGTAKYLSDGLGNDSSLALSTGNIGIGTNVPSNDLTLSKSVAAGNVVLQIENTSTTGSARLWFGNNANSSGGRIQYFGATHAVRPNLFSIGTDAADDVIFETTGAERMRITSTGNVGIGTSSPVSKLSVSDGTNAFHVGHDANGPYLSGANNAFTVYKRLSYDATDHLFFSSSAERFRITNNGVTFNGDTAAANALDDYEEGTWTMGISFGGASVGVTTSANTGTYTKIGRQVTVNGYLKLTSKGSSTGIAFLTGLPFTVGNTAANFGAASLWFDVVTYANQFQGRFNQNLNYIELEEITEAGVTSNLTNADFADSSGIMISATYFV